MAFEYKNPFQPYLDKLPQVSGIDIRPQWQKDLEAVQATYKTPAPGSVASVGGFTPVAGYTPVSGGSTLIGASTQMSTPANVPKAVPTASTTLPAKGYETASTADSPYAYGPNPSTGGNANLAPAAPFVPNWAQGTPTTPTPGSAASAATAPWLYNGETPEERAKREAAQAILENTGQITDAETIYQNKLRQQQAEIDAQNKMYNDMLVQSRINNAPEYLRRANATAALAVNQGLTGSNVGQGMENQTQDANMQQQAAAEALIEERRQQAMANIKGEIRKSAEAEALANVAAKKSGAEAILTNLKSRQSARQDTATRAIKGLLAAGVDVMKMSPAEKKSYLDGIGISESDWNGLSAELTKAAQAEKTAAEKDAADLAYKKAQTAKELSDVANWGKMTDYQRAQIAVETFKANNPGKDAQKENAMAKIAAELKPGVTLPDGKTPVLDQNNYITPEAYNFMVNKAPELGLTKEEVLKQYGHFLYNDPKSGYSKYGLTGADTKVLTAVAPQ